jgi:cation transport ATPase
MTPVDSESSSVVTPSSPALSQPETFESLLNRPREQRVREFKYRFAQSVVFGLPVLALQRYGPALGWVEAGRWVGVLQLLLAGWVVYVAAAGMLFEGIVTLARRLPGARADFVIALIAVVVYLLSAVSIAHLILRGTPWFPARFDVVVALLILWCGGRWWWLRARCLAG